MLNARRCVCASGQQSSRPIFGSGTSRNVRNCASRVVPKAVKLADLKDVPLIPLSQDGQQPNLPNLPGIYAVYSADEAVQYIGLSRKVSVSVSNHTSELPELARGVRVAALSDATRDDLLDAWKIWLEQVVEATGNIPPGNMPGETKWHTRQAKPAKPEIRLTAGKAINCDINELIGQVVTTNKVVAFIKGTRTEPQCGFSNRLLTILNTLKVEYEVLNVLDETHNPGLRDAIKTYSQWPTIPQLYVKGDFVGGVDIVDEMVNSGELQQLITK